MSEYIPTTLTSPTAIAYLEYDPEFLPEPPSKDWLRVVCISDTHSRTFPVPPGDVLLHSGDLTNSGTYEGFKITVDWLRSLPHPIKIIIAGNHDLVLHEDWYATQFDRWHHEKEDIAPVIELLKGPGKRVVDGPNISDSGLVYLQDQSFEFQAREGGRKWSVYGSPWSPEFCNWAFGYTRDERGEELVKNIPKTDILLTHGPPFDILDLTVTGEHAGCEALRARLALLQPRLHLFGHIHEAHGAEIKSWDAKDPLDKDVATKEARTVFVNASSWPMGRGKRTRVFGGPGFQPVVVDLLDLLDDTAN